MLKYQVLSSDGITVYRVSFEGEGKELKAYCTCPAGERGGKFCKHVSALLNKDMTKIVKPSDKIEALEKILPGSSLLSKNAVFINKTEKVWFFYNDVKISSMEDLYKYLKIRIDDKTLIELKNRRLALYKADYYKNGNPKYTAKNRITFMEHYLGHFNVNRQFYKYFAPAGQRFIEDAKEALGYDFREELRENR